MIAAIFDRGRRETAFFTALAVALVLLRTAVFLFRGYVDFDSDQAIIGLMAKHLSEFRRFPLFYYGQNYMLGAQAWLVAPLFWVARPSIGIQKIPLVAFNVVTAVLLLRLVISNLALRPALAFLAALPFVVPTPIISASFLQSVEPAMYVLILWALRDRPLAFGALLAFGFLQREFTMYALPAVALVELGGGSLRTAGTAKHVVKAAVGFMLVWLIVDAAKRLLNGTSLILQAQQLGSFACFDGPSLLYRARFVFARVWPVLSGGTEMPLDHYAMRSSAVVGSALIGWTVDGALVLMLVRLAWLWKVRRPESSIGFAVYLSLVGCCSLAAYTLTCAYAYPVVRYFSLGVFLPIGCFAAFMAWERSMSLRRAVIVVFAVWGSANLVDNVRVLRDAFVNPQPNPHAELTAFLLDHRIRYARASYWDSYIVDFLSRERVIVASVGPVRIPDYQRLVDEHSDSAVLIERMPCEGQMHVSEWCIQSPAKRP
jgi:hypothetical protein